MAGIPIFSSNISLYENEDAGLRIECSTKFVPLLVNALRDVRFLCGESTVVLPTAKNIYEWVEFSISNGSFEDMKATVCRALTDYGVTIVEELFTGPGQVEVRLNLTNLSAFDKRA